MDTCKVVCRNLHNYSNNAVDEKEKNIPKKDFILVESPYLLHTLSLKHKRQPNLHWESISERRLLYSGSLIVNL